MHVSGISKELDDCFFNNEEADDNDKVSSVSDPGEKGADPVSGTD